MEQSKVWQAFIEIHEAQHEDRVFKTICHFSELRKAQHEDHFFKTYLELLRTQVHFLSKSKPWILSEFDDAVRLSSQTSHPVMAIKPILETLQRTSVHRDLKRNNLLRDDSKTEICDFGFPSMGLPSADFTRDCGAGTPPTYLAPEQQENEKPTHTIDVYAFVKRMKGRTAADTLIRELAAAVHNHWPHRSTLEREKMELERERKGLDEIRDVVMDLKDKLDEHKDNLQMRLAMSLKDNDSPLEDPIFTDETSEVSEIRHINDVSSDDDDDDDIGDAMSTCESTCSYGSPFVAVHEVFGMPWDCPSMQSIQAEVDELNDETAKTLEYLAGEQHMHV